MKKPVKTIISLAVALLLGLISAQDAVNAAAALPATSSVQTVPGGAKPISPNTQMQSALQNIVQIPTFATPAAQSAMN